MKSSYTLLLAIMVLTISLFWGTTSGKESGTTVKVEATTGKSTPGPKKNGTGKGKICTCTFIYQPECGKDGKTYANKCMRECKGVEKEKNGDCEGKFANLLPKNETGGTTPKN